MSVKAPWAMLGDETSSTPPSKVSCRLKRLRKLNWAEAEVMAMARDSRRLSLISGGSLTTAQFGAESGVVGEVTQSGVGPTAFVATQPAGNVGAVTPSKFSMQVSGGVGVGVAVGVGNGVGEGIAPPSFPRS